MIKILKVIPVKLLQLKHKKLVEESVKFLRVNKQTSYIKIIEAEKVATQIQNIKKFNPW